MDSAAVTLPVIDFTSQELKPGTPTWESIKREVMKALEAFGCFKAQYDKIPSEIRKAIFESTSKFFDQPLEAKNNNAKVDYSIDDDYFNSTSTFETIGVPKPTVREMVESLTDLMWPQGNSSFREKLLSYSEHISRLDKIIRKMILESLGLEKYIDEHMNLISNIRFSMYKPPNTNETVLALKGHTDKNMLAILDENGAKGLEILTKDDQWVGVDFPPNSFIVLIGDVFHGWTNGRLAPAHHRVTITGNEARYSIGIFSNFKSDYAVEAPEEVVDEDHPRLYKPFTVSGLVAFHHAYGNIYHSTMKAYCGV